MYPPVNQLMKYNTALWAASMSIHQGPAAHPWRRQESAFELPSPGKARSACIPSSQDEHIAINIKTAMSLRISVLELNSAKECIINHNRYVAEWFVEI